MYRGGPNCILQYILMYIIYGMKSHTYLGTCKSNKLQLPLYINVPFDIIASTQTNVIRETVNDHTLVLGELLPSAVGIEQLA